MERKILKLQTKSFAALSKDNKKKLKQSNQELYNYLSKSAKANSKRIIEKYVYNYKLLNYLYNYNNNSWNEHENGSLVFRPCSNPKKNDIPRKKIIKCLKLQKSDIFPYENIFKYELDNFFKSLGLTNNSVIKKLKITQRQKHNLLNVFTKKQLATILNYVQHERIKNQSRNANNKKLER